MLVSCIEYDILRAHTSFASKSPLKQQKWLLDYFTTNCPNADSGEMEPNISYLWKGSLLPNLDGCAVLALADFIRCEAIFYLA